jgi:catechol-2,3-dioxygenase
VAKESQVTQETNPDWAQHLALEVDTLEELEAAKARLESRGIDVLGPVDHGFIRSIYFYDPSGHRLELAARTYADGELERFAAEAAELLDGWTRRKKDDAALAR